MSISDQIIERAKAARIAAGLGLAVHFPEGHDERSPDGQPFTCFASTPETRDRWVASFKRRGAERIEIIGRGEAA